MKKSTEERLREAEDIQRQAGLRVAALKAERSKEQRQLDARRKVILGAWLIAHKPELVSKAVEGLKRDQDRAAFEGWQLLPATATDLNAPALPQPHTV
jgi:hypothetical protein